MIVTSGTLIIWSLSRLDNGTRMPCRMGSTGVRALVWTASGMGHWKRLIKIPSDTACYYCINNMTYLIHVYYCVVVLVTVPVGLSTIMFPVDFATCYYSCYFIHYHGTCRLCYITWYLLHFMWWHTLHVHIYLALHAFGSCLSYRHYPRVCTSP